jgi:pyruvate dehydrogenase E2 component (dihydrolipoamide acetyltransferase)
MQLSNIDASPMENVGNWRKMSIGVYGPQSDPSVYGVLAQDCTNLVKYLDELNNKSDIKVSIYVLIGKICAIVLDEHPQINGSIIKGRLYQRKTVDIFFQVALRRLETELAGVKIEKCEKKNVIQIAKEMRGRISKLKTDPDNLLRKAQSKFKDIPWQVIPVLGKVINFLQFDLNINLENFGIPRDSFGSIMINSLGSLGLDLALAPLVPISGCPLLLGPGRIIDKPVVVNSEIVIRPMMNICVTFDHRFMDGALAAQLAKRLNQLMDDPFKYDSKIMHN